MTEPVAGGNHSPNPQELGSPNLPDQPSDNQAAESRKDLPAFEPIFTLVTNTSDASTHHPHVRYIFSDDDPEILTQALAECEATAARDGSDKRAMMLDLSPDDKGGYSISAVSSLSPSWAVLDAQLSQISPPSSDGGNGGAGGGTSGDAGDEGIKRPERLMLRLEGIESSALGSEVDLALSEDQSRQGSGSRSAIGGGGGSNRPEVPPGSDNAEDYGVLIEDFQKRLAMLRKVVDTGEERRNKRGVTIIEQDTADPTLHPETEDKKPSD